MRPLLRELTPGARALFDGNSYARILFTDPEDMLASAAASRNAARLAHRDIFPIPNTSDRVDCNSIPVKEMAVVIIAGQSNGHNSTKPNDLYRPKTKFYNLNVEDGNCYVAREHALGTTGQGSAFALPLGDELIISGRYLQALIVPIAIGGSVIEEWRPDGGRYFPRFERALQLLASHRLSPTFILWHQGEANAVPLAYGITYGLFSAPAARRKLIVTPDLRRAAQLGYAAHFYAMVARLRQLGVQAPIFPAVATICGEPTPEPAIQAAQKILPDPKWGIFPGPDTDGLDFTSRHDRCHFDARGIQLMSKAWMSVLADYMRQKN